ncbi:MAG: hypothetical protein NTX53_20955 [candidate division WOR-3 bacterium]|nr:hypothetical protein [candidate division WOR-3 bacterium]
MRNSECTIHITTRRGRTWTYRRDKDGWTQTGPTGTVRSITAEQLLSHILPPLAAGNRSSVSVTVEPDVVGKRRRRPAKTGDK